MNWLLLQPGIARNNVRLEVLFFSNLSGCKDKALH
jgi:hypothetical protein